MKTEHGKISYESIAKSDFENEFCLVPRNFYMIFLFQTWL